MLNFKFIKFAFVFFIIIYFIIGYSPALAKFITIYPNQDEEDSSSSNGMVAAAIEAIPTKTDGEIVDCFDYYRFPSVQTSFEPLKEFYEPGQTVYFKGELINENDYPIADGYLFVRIARFNENYVREGHDIADEFFANSGPQGREKFYLDGGERKKTVFSWNAPENLPEGIYVVSFSFVVGKKMNLAGLSFTNEIIAGSTEFEIRKNAMNAKRVFLEKSSFAVNGKGYNHIGFWPRFGKGAKVEVAGRLKNETAKKENVKLVYDLYYWDGLDAQNKISSRSEDITVAPNSSYSFKYVIPKMDETVYFLRIAAIAGNDQKSIVNLRFASEQERPRINFFSPMKFPVLTGETMTNFACFHNTADKSAQGQVTMNVFDESGDKIQTLDYEGEITGRIMAIKKDMVAAKNYSYLKMTASVSGADGRETDSYEMIYDCKNMNPENKECVKIQEEKTAAGASGKPFDKKDMAVGIIALMAIMAVAALARKFFINKAKPPLMFLLFALAVSSAVFLAGGADNRVLAKSVTVSSYFNFPEGVCDKNNSGNNINTPYGNICISNGELYVIHRVNNDSVSDNLTVGKKINFTYNPDSPFWSAFGGAYDTPYGVWCDDGDDVDDNNCKNKMIASYADVTEAAEQTDNLKEKRDIEMTFLAQKPSVDITSSDSSVIKCEGMTCEALKKGSATITARIGSFFARPWIKFTVTNINKTYEYSVLKNDWTDEKRFKEGIIHDVNLDSATLTWEIAVDPPSPTCTAKFSPAEIKKGESTTFQWDSLYDKNGTVPITCTDKVHNYDGSSSGSFSISPSENQTCVVTVANDNGVATCSGGVEVIEFIDPPPSSSSSSSSSSSNSGYSLTVNINADNCGGTIFNEERGGSSGATEIYTGYASGDTVTLTATPGAYSGGICKMTGGWNTSSGGNCAGGILSKNNTKDDTCELTMGSADKSVSVSFNQPSSSSSSAKPPEPDTYNLTFKTSGSGSGNATRYAYDDTWGWTDSKTMNNGDTHGIGRDWKFKLVPSPSSGSYFSSWSGCGSVNPDNECILEKNPYPGADKTVTVTFSSSSGPFVPGGCAGCGPSVKAYISARETVVTDDNSTVVTWTSDNADSCTHPDSGLGSDGYKDTGWLTAGDTTSGSYTTSNFTTSGGSRTYTIECTNGSQTDSASITISVGVWNGGSPSVSIWADPQSIGYKKTSMIKWLSNDVFPGSCFLGSVNDSLGGYLTWYNVPPYSFTVSGYYKYIGNNNTTGQITGKLASNTIYKIQCRGFNYTDVKGQTTVAVAKPVSNFTLTNPAGASLVATIVEGLSANSGNIALSLSGEAIGNVSLSAGIPAISGAKAQFSSDDGATWSDTLSVDISAISQVKIKAIKIPGATPAGTYNTAITATDTGTGGITKKLNVNLRVDRVSSEWKEF